MTGERIKPDIQDLPPFSGLNAEARRFLQSRLRSYVFSAGDTVVGRGKRGGFWALVGFGLIDLDFGNQNLQTLLPGQAFGEAMLCEDAPSQAAVTARSEAGLWVLTRTDWLEAVRQSPSLKPVKISTKKNFPWVWLTAGLILLLFTVFFVGSDLLQFTNERVVGYTLNVNRPDLAERYLEFSLRWQPRTALLYDAYGYSLYVQGKQSPAIKAFEQAIAADALLASAQNNLGVTLLGSWQTSQAIQHLEQAVELDPGNPEAYFNLANAYQAAGNQEAAIKTYHRVIELAPDRMDAQEQWASLMMKKGEYDAAEQVWSEVLQVDPANARAHRNLGIMAVLEDRPGEALLELKQAYEAGIRDAEMYLYLGLAFSALDQPEKAAAAFESALTLTNDPALIQLVQYHLQDIEGTNLP